MTAIAYLARQGGVVRRGTGSGLNSSPVGKPPAVLLVNPKTPRNVAAALRACSCYGIGQLWITGRRVPLTSEDGQRLPREERMKGYGEVELIHCERPFDLFSRVAVPVAVELLPSTESLPAFEHPPHALYVFGPEDGSLNSMILTHCRRFLSIPTRHCLNLAVAVGTVLYDRSAKSDPTATLATTLVEERGRSLA